MKGIPAFSLPLLPSPPKLACFSFKLSFNPVHIHPQSICSSYHHFPIISPLFFHFPLLFNPFTATSLFPRGGHALQCSFLHKTTSSHYLLTTTQESNVGGFPNISHGWHTGSVTLVFVHQSVMLSSRSSKLFRRKLRKWCLMVSEGSRQETAVVTMEIDQNVVIRLLRFHNMSINNCCFTQVIRLSQKNMDMN